MVFAATNYKSRQLRPNKLIIIWVVNLKIDHKTLSNTSMTSV